jgi:formylglycine-generating enzyme required for sulfatase activity
MRIARNIGLPMAAIIAISAVALANGMALEAERVPVPDLVDLHPGAFAYRASGGFTRDGKPEEAPLVTVTVSRPLAMMKHQVTVAEYRRCTDAGACPKIAQTRPDRPVVKISWQDAHAYASWLSRETGLQFRLPTDEEWAFGAGEKFRDDVLPGGAERADPGRRALAHYELDVATDRPADQEPQPVGSFGENRNGLLDISGNVWEWTDTCYARNALDARDDAGPTSKNCFVRVVEGRHRTYLSDFVRTARGGGCSVGIPVSNLGFRLVRDDDPWRTLRSVVEWAQQLAGLDA